MSVPSHIHKPIPFHSNLLSNEEKWPRRGGNSLGIWGFYPHIRETSLKAASHDIIFCCLGCQIFAHCGTKMQQLDRYFIHNECVVMLVWVMGWKRCIIQEGCSMMRHLCPDPTGPVTTDPQPLTFLDIRRIVHSLCHARRVGLQMRMCLYFSFFRVLPTNLSAGLHSADQTPKILSFHILARVMQAVLNI